jgi:rod shape determining protein RodA
MSYGGSSMLTVMLCIGIIMSIDRAGQTGVRNWG